MRDDGRILLVEAQENLRGILSETLRAYGHDVTAVATGEEALQAFEAHPFPLVIADAQAQGGGVELLERLHKREATSQVIVTSNTPCLDTALAALRAGAFDCLFKPFGDPDLVARVAERAVEKSRMEALALREQEDLERRNDRLERANRMFRELSRRDRLTGLFDAAHFRECLIGEASRSVRHGSAFSVAVIDVDGLAALNQTRGPVAGDSVLAGVARILRERLRKSDLAARHATRDFALLLPETPGKGARYLAEELRERVLASEFQGQEGQQPAKVTVSVGVAAFPDHGQDGDGVLRNAEEALTRAKRGGRNKVRLSGES